MIALRYLYVLALSIWFGGSIAVGFLAGPVSEPTLQRFFLLACSSAGTLLVSLLAMGLLGPRPSQYAARFVTGVVMFGATFFGVREVHRLTPAVLAVIVFCGLALLFWEARDGTRAA